MKDPAQNKRAKEILEQRAREEEWVERLKEKASSIFTGVVTGLQKAFKKKSNAHSAQPPQIAPVVPPTTTPVATPLWAPQAVPKEQPRPRRFGQAAGCITICLLVFIIGSSWHAYSVLSGGGANNGSPNVSSDGTAKRNKPSSKKKGLSKADKAKIMARNFRESARKMGVSISPQQAEELSKAMMERYKPEKAVLVAASVLEMHQYDVRAVDKVFFYADHPKMLNGYLATLVMMHNLPQHAPTGDYIKVVHTLHNYRQKKAGKTRSVPVTLKVDSKKAMAKALEAYREAFMASAATKSYPEKARILSRFVKEHPRSTFVDEAKKAATSASRMAILVTAWQRLGRRLFDDVVIMPLNRGQTEIFKVVKSVGDIRTRLKRAGSTEDQAFLNLLLALKLAQNFENDGASEALDAADKAYGQCRSSYSRQRNRPMMKLAIYDATYVQALQNFVTTQKGIVDEDYDRVDRELVKGQRKLIFSQVNLLNGLAENAEDRELVRPLKEALQDFSSGIRPLEGK